MPLIHFTQVVMEDEAAWISLGIYIVGSYIWLIPVLHCNAGCSPSHPFVLGTSTVSASLTVFNCEVWALPGRMTRSSDRSGGPRAVRLLPLPMLKQRAQGVSDVPLFFAGQC